MSGIIHCQRCGHHVNIQFGETTGYCPICDEGVLDTQEHDFRKNDSVCSGVSHSECVAKDFLNFEAEQQPDDVTTMRDWYAE